MDARPNILLLQSDEHSYRFLSARKQVDGGTLQHPQPRCAHTTGNALFDNLLSNASVLPKSDCHALRSPLPSLRRLG